ncbi:MAG: hypothetical protein KAS32_19480 [Candidatus Peribacteraceae bacterium]|nr:hypothetical protein [Candidatus Peribacteraceae bacterium]
MAKVIQVIHVETTRGDGSENNRYRSGEEYWSLDGELLATSETAHILYMEKQKNMSLHQEVRELRNKLKENEFVYHN